jgi:uncharacterized protein (DUF1501 family)
MLQTMNRRRMLRVAAGGVAAVGLWPRLTRLASLNAEVSAPSPDYKALVCVFLFGGNDANNMVVPVSTSTQAYADYLAARGAALAVPQASLATVHSASGDVYGLHPSLTPLRGLYNRRRLAVAANVGALLRPTTKKDYTDVRALVPANLFSHADQQQQWQTLPGARTGWGGRTADALQSLNTQASLPAGVSFAGNVAFLVGQSTTQATLTAGGLSLEGVDGSRAASARTNALQQILSFNTGLSLIQTLNRDTAAGLDTGRILSSALGGSSTLKTQFPATSLAGQLHQVARLLAARTLTGMSRQIFFVSQGGYDTHTGQIPAQAGLLNELAGALAAFDQAVSELGLDGQVVTFTESEFGRTLQPSSGGGSDHAWGAHHLVMGAPVRGADIYGVFPKLEVGGPDDIGGRGVWLPSTSIDQYAATLASWFGVPDTSLPAVFPNLAAFPTRKLPFLS